MSPLQKMIVGFVLFMPPTTWRFCVALRLMPSTLEASSKRSLRQKSKQAAMDDIYMLTVLAAALPDSPGELEP
jgi:hypothetical protein